MEIIITISMVITIALIKKFSSVKEKELYQMVSYMRIAEFTVFLNKIQHIQNWNNSDALFEALAQHYGLETSWLDITNDFNIALFFATCFWNKDHWEPLTRKQTEVDEQHKYGMIFHMPSNRIPMRWTQAIPGFMPWTDEIVGKNENEEPVYGRLEFPTYRGDVATLYIRGFYALPYAKWIWNLYENTVSVAERF